MRIFVRDPLILSLLAITAMNAYLGWISDAVLMYRQAHTHFGTSARSQMIAKSMGVISRIGLVTHNMGPIGAAIGDSIQGISGTASAWFARSGKIHITSVNLDDIKALISAGRPYFKYNFYLWVYGAPTTTYILVYWSGYESNGCFSVTMRLLGIFCMVPGMLVNVLMPLLVRAYESSMDEYVKLATRTISTALVTGIPFSLLLLIQPSAILRALHYTAAFNDVALPLRIAGGYLLILWASTYYGLLLIACNRIDKQAHAAMIAAPFNLIITVALVILFHRQYHNGAAGAILAVAFTELLVVSIYIHALRDQPIVKPTLLALCRGFAAGIVPGVILCIPMTGRASFLCIFTLALVAFMPCALLTRAIRIEDIRPFMDVMRTKVQPKSDPPAPNAV